MSRELHYIGRICLGCEGKFSLIFQTTIFHRRDSKCSKFLCDEAAALKDVVEWTHNSAGNGKDFYVPLWGYFYYYYLNNYELLRESCLIKFSLCRRHFN
jgi:hypothetical protein